jgi:hypothetical protein
MMQDFRSAASAAYPDWIGTQRDYKAWAKRILYREQHGDTLLIPIQPQFAREALELVGEKK